MAVGVVAVALAAPPQAPASIEAAAEAYDRLDLDLAESILDRLEAPAGRRRKSTVPAVDQTDIAALRDRIILARNMMERVEKTVIVDSLRMGRDDFFTAFRLHPSTGSLLDFTEASGLFPVIDSDSLGIIDPVYVTEDRELAIWAGYDENNENDNGAIYESWRLADGTYTPAVPIFDRARIFGDGVDGQVYSPFLMTDGMTLYFAADGPGSLGNLDIFVARRDGDGFLQPANVGMPYNSPANDYMMAIDEVTGLGWWVTDRDCPDDSVTVYVFAPAEMRVNYPVDTPGLASLALLRSVELDAARRAELMARLDGMMDQTVGKETSKFEFALPDGSIATKMADFRSRDARELMVDYLREVKALDDLRGQLAGMRREYGGGKRSLAGRINSAESEADTAVMSLCRLRDDIVRSEMRTRQ